MLAGFEFFCALGISLGTAITILWWIRRRRLTVRQKKGQASAELTGEMSTYEKYCQSMKGMPPMPSDPRFARLEATRKQLMDARDAELRNR